MKRQELDLIVEWTSRYDIHLTETQLVQLWKYGEMLLAWNQKINLISRKDEEGLLIKHVLHSLLVGFFHKFSKGERVLDIGTGGGLPGIPLAIAFPETLFLLTDSIGKKITACQDMISKLGLKNAVAEKRRAEELKGVRFDTIVSRQVTALPTLCKWANQLLRPGGTLVCLKGGNIDAEIEESLIYGAENLCFPEHIDTKPVDFLGERFEDKYILILT